MSLAWECGFLMLLFLTNSGLIFSSWYSARERRRVFVFSSLSHQWVCHSALNMAVSLPLPLKFHALVLSGTRREGFEWDLVALRPTAVLLPHEGRFPKAHSGRSSEKSLQWLQTFPRASSRASHSYQPILSIHEFGSKSSWILCNRVWLNLTPMSRCF